MKRRIDQSRPDLIDWKAITSFNGNGIIINGK